MNSNGLEKSQFGEDCPLRVGNEKFPIYNQTFDDQILI